jgi:DNA-binding Lrp family transcriptional regulator
VLQRRGELLAGLATIREDRLTPAVEERAQGCSRWSLSSLASRSTIRSVTSRRRSGITRSGGGIGFRTRRYASSGSSGVFLRLRRPGTLPGYVTAAKGRYDSRQPEQEVTVVNAYILIQTEVGKAAQVAKEVAAIKGVASAEDVTGPYDVIVRAEARNVDELGKLVVAKIQAVDGITRTLTCPVVHL